MPLTFDESPLDQAHFLRTIARVLPGDYLRQMLSRPDSGYELFRAVAAIGARSSEAINNVLQGSYALHARGGARARGVVTISRASSGSGTFVLQAGSIVATARGREYATLRDAEFSGSTLFLDVEIEAVADGWEWNVRGARTSASGVAMAGMIDRVPDPKTLPTYADATLTAENVLDVLGGRAPMLDAVAADRGIVRAPGESDDVLSLRARRLPDTVSPGAVLRLLHAMLDPYGIEFDLVETFEHSYQEAYDAPSENVGTPTYQAIAPTNADFDTTTFVYDDPRAPDVHFRNRTMDLREFRAAFVVVVNRNTTLRDLGMAYDDPGDVPGDFHPPLPGPQRQTPAYDATGAMPSELVYGAAYDGFDIDQRALYAALWDSLQQIRAAGVAAILDYVRP